MAAAAVYLLVLHEKPESAGGYTQQSQIRVEMLLSFLQEEIENENAESEEKQFHLRQDDQAIAVDVIQNWVKEGVHVVPYLASVVAGAADGAVGSARLACS